MPKIRKLTSLKCRQRRPEDRFDMDVKFHWVVDNNLKFEDHIVHNV